MRILLLAVGRLKSGPERELFDRYLERAGKGGRSLGLTIESREIPEGRAADAVTRKAHEAAAIGAIVPSGGLTIALDEEGQSATSRALAERIARWRDGGTPDLAFVIGGPDGLDATIAGKAALRLAFGAMTWPHQLVRIMLAEQIYRTTTILAGHPYHRD